MVEKSYSKTVIIRADGNQLIGTGHVMRCLSIADQLKECGAHVVFFMADNAITTVVENKGFECICLDSKWDDMESEISSIIPY